MSRTWRRSVAVVMPAPSRIIRVARATIETRFDPVKASWAGLAPPEAESEAESGASGVAAAGPNARVPGAGVVPVEFVGLDALFPTVTAKLADAPPSVSPLRTVAEHT